MTMNYNILGLILRKVGAVQLSDHKENFKITLLTIKHTYINCLNSSEHTFLVRNNFYKYLSSSEDKFNRFFPGHLCDKCLCHKCLCDYIVFYQLLSCNSQFFRYRSELIQHQKTYWCTLNRIFNKAHHVIPGTDGMKRLFGPVSKIVIGLIGFCYSCKMIVDVYTDTF